MSGRSRRRGPGDEAHAAALEVKFSPAPEPTVSADGTFSGYATLFGRADLSGDVVAPGAFARVLGEKEAGRIKLLYQHDPAEPIGRWLLIAEDRRGLHVRGRITDETTRGREVRALMRDGVLDGLSIGFKTVREARDPATGHRLLLEVDLWEISIVTFPMLPEARARAAKAAAASVAIDRTRLAAGFRRAAHLLNDTRHST
ncbi:HK97 family phage prohead protease [Amorphus orientalis]|uniref:HK97 family phage prohead protease n=1 Tax=Amorphus orientalis TaxID=649198 RepID=A0AAE3VSY0_9HYPH|nr:HK97 family phage prohead protease [Amorphus orientalis]MDQ0317839.1 HK97 family phage prohead protease [Amorphus orientalis]